MKQEIQKVFLHVYSKAISPTSFVFTRKNFSAPSAMSCHEYGEQFCQIENIRALLQSHLTHLPNSESGWNSKKARYKRYALLSWLAIHNAEINGEQFKALSQDFLNLIYSLVQSDNAMDLKLILDLVPSIAYLEFWIHDTQDNSLCYNVENYKQRCLFSDVYSTLTKYTRFKSKNRNVKFIDTDDNPQKGILMESSKRSIHNNQLQKQCHSPCIICILVGGFR